MKEYPSIEGPNGDFGKPCIAFYKYDGSNLRFEWSPKKGWNKFGTRTSLFDKSDPVFGSAVDLFMATQAEGIERVIRDTKEFRNNERVTAYCEFFGPKSFAGIHDLEIPNEPMELVLFDINLHKKGILGPREFVNHFGHLKTAQVVYEGNFNQTLIDAVRNRTLPVWEGVIAKGGSGHDLWMRKIKSNDYLDKLRAVFAGEWERYA
mgnify:FL=1